MTESTQDEVTRMLLAIEAAGGVLPPKPDHDSTRRWKAAPSLYLDRSSISLPLPSRASLDLSALPR